ncbi:hypothetical protein AJ79_00642 [Helicocarpus griseus UAMH5409]|uniref:P68 RBP/TagC-like beta-propeller domain-containing protein n=1 Tax=Helicocarpus griseus UAMH5409 TaxID=1447875 RepID=A0A2B7YB91_9EURO|nr:hypothetical protein AJ79_00642 [Helicocarpus griseus UAMH5409]
MRLLPLLSTALLALLTPPTTADLPKSQRFDLTKPSHDFFRSKPLHDNRVQQSFAFDNTNGHLFVAQLQDGTDDSSGDLCITRMDLSGDKVSHMHLNGFGHGVSFGAQAVGSETYLWTEVEANGNGYGKKLARFQWEDGKTLSQSSDALKKYVVVEGATEHTASIDPVSNRLIVRYNKSGKYIAAYDLDAASEGDFSNPLVNFKQPALSGFKSDVFQGYAVYGSYMYVLTGTSYDSNGGKVDSEVASIDMNSGEIVQGPTLTKAGESLSFREPEGMAVYRTGDGEVRLFLGFASGDSGGRRSNLFYKNVLV